MNPYELFKKAGIPVSRNSAIECSDRLQVATYYGYRINTDADKINALRETLDKYEDYLVVKSRGGVHALPDGEIRIESREEFRLQLAYKKSCGLGC